MPPTSPAAAVKTPTTPTVLKKVEEELGLDIDAELVSNIHEILKHSGTWLIQTPTGLAEVAVSTVSISSGFSERKKNIPDTF